MAHSKQPKKPPKLQTFQLVQKNLAIVGICQNLMHSQYPFNRKIFINFSILISYIICSMVYLFYEPKTFTENTRTILMCSFAVLSALILLVLIVNVKELFNFINDCENIVNTTLKYSASRSIFTETVQFEQTLSEIIFFVVVKVTPVLGIFPWIIYSYFIYFTNDLGNAAFELPVFMWFPFDWQNPFGFLAAIAIQYIFLSYLLFIVACVFALGIGSNLCMIAMSKCIKENLLAISKNSHAKFGKQKHLREQLIEFIEFHSRAKQLVRDFSNIFHQFVALLFASSLVQICSAMLMIQLQIIHHSDNLAVLFITTLQTVYAFGAMFIACEMSQRVNLAFDKCSTMIDQFKWYLFPLDVQRMLFLITHYAQQSVVINCFGSWPCDRETFKHVTKTAFSYFTMLRQFYN